MISFDNIGAGLASLIFPAYAKRESEQNLVSNINLGACDRLVRDFICNDNEFRNRA